MRQYFSKLLQGNFIRNVFVLAGGTLLSQIIILVTLPIVTRLYSPTEYGTYSMYLSIIGILLMLVSFSYENAITLPEDDRTAFSVISLSLRICIGVSIASGIGIYILQEPLSIWLHESYLPHYYFFFIISLFGAGFYQILNYWSIRKKYFRQLSRTKYVQSLSQVGSQMGLSLLHLGPLGLILGDIVGRFGGLFPQWRLWRKDVRSQEVKPDWNDLKETAYRYRRFPLLSTASNILNSLGLYLPTIMLASFYGPQVAGWFALGQRILGSPMTLVMNSVRNVYLANSSEYMNEAPGKLYDLFRKTVLHMFVIGVAIIALFVFAAPAAFSSLFGEEWRKSGEFIQILSLMYLSQFVANAVGTTIDVMERQDLHLYREIVRTFIVLGALWVAWYTHQSAAVAIWFYSIASTIGYGIHLFMSWWSVRKYREDKWTETPASVADRG